MSESIYLVAEDGGIAELAPKLYDSEAILQGFLANHPQLLSGVSSTIASERRWLLVGQETTVADSDDGSGRWSVDHLFIDAEAVPTIVEVKRSTDTRIRREVVGQMLDYAANAVLYWPVEQLRATFEVTATQAGHEPTSVLASVIGPDRDPEEFWQQVRTNLQAGRIRLVFVADAIPRELKRIVEFLNGQMNPAEVLAIEVRQYVSGTTRALVPRLIGRTAGSERAKGTVGKREKRQWDRDSLLAEVERRRSVSERDVVRRFIEWAEPRFTEVWYGEGTTDASVTAVMRRDGMAIWPVTVWSYGKVELNFQYLMSVPPFDDRELRMEWLGRINRIPGVSIGADRLDKRPSIPLSTLASDAAWEPFTAAVAWCSQKFLEQSSLG